MCSVLALASSNSWESVEVGNRVVYWILDDEVVGIAIMDFRSRTLRKCMFSVMRGVELHRFFIWSLSSIDKTKLILCGRALSG